MALVVGYLATEHARKSAASSLEIILSANTVTLVAWGLGAIAHALM